MTDPECRTTWLHHDRIQVAAFRDVIDLVVQKTPLRPGLDPAAATDVLITLFGDSTYHLLTTERGWSTQQAIDWMADGVPTNKVYPCDFDRGIITALASRFERASRVTHDDSAPCRKNGADSCKFIIAW